MMIDRQQIQQFLDDGAVTIDTPIPPEQIAAAAAALDRLLPQTDGRARAGATCNYDDPALLDLIQHPFFEQVACKVLDSDAVFFFQTAIITAFPQPGVEFSFSEHIDLQCTLSDFEGSPRRLPCSFFLWLSNVKADQAPLMYRPGSHLPLVAHWEKQADLAGKIPRIIGIKAEDLPDFDHAEPRPVLARAGQVSVLTTAMVHGGSVNTGPVPRKALVITFHDASTTVGLPVAQEETKRIYDETLRQLLRPERRHLIRPTPTTPID